MINITITIVECHGGQRTLSVAVGLPQILERHDVEVARQPVEVTLEHGGADLHRRKREAIVRVEALDDSMIGRRERHRAMQSGPRDRVEPAPRGTPRDGVLHAGPKRNRMEHRPPPSDRARNARSGGSAAGR